MTTCVMLVGLALGGLLHAQDPTWGFEAFPAPEGPKFRLELRNDWWAFAPIDLEPGLTEALRGMETGARVQARLTAEAETPALQGRLELWLDPVELAQDPSRLLHQAWGRYTADGWRLEAGLMKPVWGRADALRVLDVLTPQDLRTFVLESPLDRKIPQPLIRAVVEPLGSTRLEGVFTLWREADRLPLTGRWVPRSLRQQREAVYQEAYQEALQALQAQAYAAAYAQAMAQTNGNHTLSAGFATSEVSAQLSLLQAQAQAQAEEVTAHYWVLPPALGSDTAQAGLRATANLGPVDLGLQYWWGHYRLPSFDTAFAQHLRLNLTLDRIHHFGADLALALFGWSVRAEGAVDLSTDLKGDEPAVRNPALSWSLGVDREVGGLRFLAETRQRWILNHGGITQPQDVEFNTRAHDTLSLVRLGQRLWQDTVEWELAVLYGWEDVNAAFLPKLAIEWSDFRAELLGHFAVGRDDRGLFSQFWDNRLIRLRLSYQL